MLVRMWCVVIAVGMSVGCEHARERPAPVTSAPADAQRAAPPDASLVSAFPPLRLDKTAALITRADLAAKVDVLAAQPRIEASYVGIGGSPSAIFATWDA